MKISLYFSFAIAFVFFLSCGHQSSSNPEADQKKEMTAKDILGNPDYLAISYGGYRQNSRDIQPTITELKEDMKILYAMGVRIIRTYNVHLPQAANVLEAISQLKKEDANFEMYVMLGAWIDCKDAWTDNPDHENESERNPTEINTAVELSNKYPDIVKVIAVGNEAMVHWASSYFVRPRIILKWVNHLQSLKKEGKMPSDLWITSSDNFATWGGGDKIYQTEDLEKLIHAVDFVSMHTYPMHETHYDPEFWGIPSDIGRISKVDSIQYSLNSALDYAARQYKSVSDFVTSIGADKEIHIGETGWASSSNGFYGPSGTRATDEYKEGVYYKLMREWSSKNNVSCFYFEAFDENWKDAENPGGSENHFGIFDIDGQAKFAIWDLVDDEVFKGLSRDGKEIGKTYDGNKESLLEEVLAPPSKK